MNLKKFVGVSMVMMTLAFIVGLTAAQSSDPHGTFIDPYEHFAARRRAEQSNDTFTDPRDGKTYRTIRGGNIHLTWMAENLNYHPGGSGSWCYDNNTANCAKYGRLYDWNTAMRACPDGWRLPTGNEWDLSFVGGGMRSGTALKSASDWEPYSGIPTGTNFYGFTALPGGYRSGGNFHDINKVGMWWASTESNANRAQAHVFFILYNRVDGAVFANSKSNGYSVRCVRSD